MTQDIRHHLQRHFGFSQLRPGQEEVIRHLLDGKSAAAVFPTGGGKSLCYQLPALLLPDVTLVVSPLIALMKDQIDALAARGILARRLDSSLTGEAYREVMAQLRARALPLLYVAPERFNNERFRESLRNVRISLFAVDEAHCISEWGHNFRPDYLKLAGFAREFGAERILALTATATPPVLDDICRLFDIEPHCAIQTGFYRANLTIDTLVVGAAERDRALLESIRDQPKSPAIVYVTLQRTAEEVAGSLTAAGLPARAYHAGLKDEVRSAIQEWFMAADHAIVVATIAFGMGVDKANIRAVYHYNLPKSLENYSQEIGRAGRDGGQALCRMLVCPDDLNVLENFIYGDTPDAGSIRELIERVFGQGDDFDESLYTLSSETDIRPLVLRTLLTYLELDGYLQSGTPFYSDYNFKPLQSSREILGRFQGERRAFLAGVFRRAIKGRSWFKLDLEQTARALGASRERIVVALDWLAEKGLLEVKAAGIRHRFRVLKRPQTFDALAAELYQRILKREQAEIGRLQQVLDLVSLDSCQTNALAAHFGEARREPCGHCGWCERGKSEIPPRRMAEISDDLSRKVERLKSEPGISANPRLLARLLCGITSPRLSRAKMTGHDLFGSLERAPFAEVLRRVGQGTGEGRGVSE
uniref:ATP-dependent DNA helicase RecQ n=1 Tax=Candidatus Kentrum sp. LPFa TaxID=2126335 RepID=A0A450WV18_9GAMM|nr:MAG: ATP-dependent DNA helicase RecQ [Candidatus Kentron sp. LPFa]